MSTQDAVVTTGGAGVEAAEDELRVRFVTVHGHRRAYRMAGSGPVLLLIHGLACDSGTWAEVLPRLAEHHTVIAPDLLGHGDSDKHRADYSVGGYANGMRDLLTVLGIDKVTVVGHSLGGGVAMQFAYQFPERTERLVLVSPGGLGTDVSVLIRSLTLPGAWPVLEALGSAPVRPLVSAFLDGLGRSRLPFTHDLNEVAAVYRRLCDRDTRSAILHVTRSVVDWRGQVIQMTDRAYLTALLPVCVVWGGRDRVIPVRHAQAVGVHAPDATVVVFDRAEHFPHRDEPERFAEVLTQFVATTPPATYRRARWRAMLRRGDTLSSTVHAVVAPAPAAVGG